MSTFLFVCGLIVVLGLLGAGAPAPYSYGGIAVVPAAVAVAFVWRLL